MEFLFIYTLGIMLVSGLITHVFTTKYAQKRGFDLGNKRGFETGYGQGHKDALKSVAEGKKVVERIQQKAGQRKYGVLLAELVEVKEIGVEEK